MKHIGPDAKNQKHTMPQARVNQPRRHSLLNPHAVKKMHTMPKKQRVFPLGRSAAKKTLAMPQKDKHGYY